MCVKETTSTGPQPARGRFRKSVPKEKIAGPRWCRAARHLRLLGVRRGGRAIIRRAEDATPLHRPTDVREGPR